MQTLIEYLLHIMLLLKNPATPVDDKSNESFTSQQLQISSWEWHLLYDENPDLPNFFSSANEAGIQKIYIDIGAYLDAIESGNPATKIEYINKIEKIIGEANKNQISVYALTGNKDWIFDSHSYLNQLSIDAVIDYNETISSTHYLQGIQFDIEPHSFEDFIVKQDDYIKSYLKLISSNTTYIQDKNPRNNLEVGYALPFWLDGTHPEVKEISFNGSLKYPVYHILDLLSTYTNSSVFFMAYRDKAFGPNSIIEHVTSEFKYINDNKLTVNVYIGLEFNDEIPKTITFYGKDSRYIEEQVQIVNNYFDKFESYKGIIVHQTSSYVSALKD